MAMRAQLEEALYDALITTLTEHGVISDSDDSVGEERYHSFLEYHSFLVNVCYFCKYHSFLVNIYILDRFLRLCAKHRSIFTGLTKSEFWHKRHPIFRINKVYSYLHAHASAEL